MGTEVTVIPRIRKVYSATYANLPTTGLKVGDLGYATDRLVFYRWSGAAWEAITIHSSSGVAANIPTAANMPEGSLYFETDTSKLKQIQTGAWAEITFVYADADAIAAAKTDAALLNPSGMIILWHGTIANIPSGFVICDGNNSTPNLLTKFVQGVATAATDPGATGGAATVTLAEADIPAHIHNARGTASNTGAAGLTYMGSGLTNNYPSTSTGGGGAHENEPAFYDVAFLMKT